LLFIFGGLGGKTDFLGLGLEAVELSDLWYMSVQDVRRGNELGASFTTEWTYLGGNFLGVVASAPVASEFTIPVVAPSVVSRAGMPHLHTGQPHKYDRMTLVTHGMYLLR
jgi:hypothetical protein